MTDEAHCVVCSCALAEGSLVHDGVYVDARGGTHSHLICLSCLTRAKCDTAFHARAFARVKLTFEPVQGAA